MITNHIYNINILIHEYYHNVLATLSSYIQWSHKNNKLVGGYFLAIAMNQVLKVFCKKQRWETLLEDNKCVE